jgi:hypothetical protein
MVIRGALVVELGIAQRLDLQIMSVAVALSWKIEFLDASSEAEIVVRGICAAKGRADRSFRSADLGRPPPLK